MRHIRSALWCIGLCAIFGGSPTTECRITGWQMQDSAAVGTATGEAIAASDFAANRRTGSPERFSARLPDQGRLSRPVIG